MTANTNRADLRRRPRIFIPEHPVITDVISGEALGQLVNLSGEGLMIASTCHIPCNTIRQIRVPLVKNDREVEIGVGVESLWCEHDSDSGMHWTGFQIIDISPEHQYLLDTILGS